MTHSDVHAVSTAMLTSDSVLLKHYVHTNPQHEYQQAQQQLNSLLGKRVRGNDEIEQKDDSAEDE